MRAPARAAIRPERQRKSDMASFPAPTAGWISNRALALPEQGPQGAYVLDNWFPIATGAILRRGSLPHAQLADGEPVLSLFKYSVGANLKLFGATATTIYDITSVAVPEDWTLGEDTYEIGDDSEDWELGDSSVVDREVWEGTLGGYWSVVQFSVTGGVYLIGVNGESTGFIYDGTAFWPNVAGGVWALSYDGETVPFTVGETVTGGTSGATGVIYEIDPGGALVLTDITGVFENDEALTGSLGGAAVAASTQSNIVPGVEFGNGLTSADMDFVWVYKNALYFVQKESLSAWYLPVDSIGGEASELPLGAEFGLGGSLLLGQSWSLNASAQGGLSEQCVFLSTEGEAVVFQGLHPTDTQTWNKVGTYRIGAPLGKRGFIRAGGDLVFATTIGFVALSTAIQVDLGALAPRAVSYAIEDEWNEAVLARGAGWVCMLWPESQMVAIAPPRGEGEPLFLVSNARTGAWSRFTNWNATCMEVFNGILYFGTPNGFVMQAMVGGTDFGVPYTGVYAPLYTDHGKPSVMKRAKLARVEMIANAPINEKLSCRFDFDDDLPSPPTPELVPIGNEWDNAVWNESLWGAERPTVIVKRRHSVSGNGYKLAPVVQITSGAVTPLDAQLVTLDVTYDVGDVFT